MKGAVEPGRPFSVCSRHACVTGGIKMINGGRVAGLYTPSSRDLSQRIVKSGVPAAKRRKNAAHGLVLWQARDELEGNSKKFPEARKKATPPTNQTGNSGTPLGSRSRIETHTAENPAKVESKAAFLAPASPPPCNPWDTPPGTAASLRPHSRSAGRPRRAAPGGRFAARATTSD